MSNTATPDLVIDVVADVVCPWCYLGWRRLKAAAAMRPSLTIELVWRPYLLDPQIPEGGVDRHAYMAKKFPDAERRVAIGRALTEAAGEDGVTLNLEKIAISPNTSAAHRLIRWAQGAGVQDAVVEGLFAAYFTEGRDIGEPETLAEIGAAAGLDPLLVLELLSKGSDAEAVARDHAIAVRGGITGAPFMIFGQQFSVMGAEAPDKMVRAIDTATTQQQH
jgi:predicted DsbA family dithiol-disulfide isomerase